MQRHRHFLFSYPSITVVITITVMLVLTLSCTEKQEVIKGFEDKELIPTLRTSNVYTLISDSGVTRYRITAAEWLIYDNATTPYWIFPRGIFVETFDSLFQVDSYIKGDTAIFLKEIQQWELRGNVLMENAQHETFSTEQLFWDQLGRTIHNDKFIHIERAESIIEGIGFESNEAMTHYKIKKTQGIFPFNDEKNAPPSATANPVAP